jgi:hypothetical protein
LKKSVPTQKARRKIHSDWPLRRWNSRDRLVWLVANTCQSEVSKRWNSLDCLLCAPWEIILIIMKCGLCATRGKIIYK